MCIRDSNDLFGMVKQLKAGFEVNEETTAFNEIMGLTGRESFIDMEHTFRHFRDGYKTRVFNYDSRTKWITKGSKDIIARTTEIYYKIKETYKPITLPEDVSKEMDSIVKHADKDVYKRQSIYTDIYSIETIMSQVRQQPVRELHPSHPG